MQARFRFLTCSLPSLLTVAFISATTAHATLIVTNIQEQNAGNFNCFQGLTTGASACSSIVQANALTDGTSTGPSSFSFAVNLVNGDNYVLSGNYFGSYSHVSGALFSANATLTYVGGSPSVASDTVVVDVQEAVYDNIGSSYDGTFTEGANICGPAGGPGWTMSAQEFVGGLGVGLLGPRSSGCTHLSNSAALSGLTNPLLSEDWQFSFTTNAGATAGYSVSSISPEPAETLPAALVLASFACVMIARKRKENVVKLGATR